MEHDRPARQVALPASALTHLRRALRKEAGALGTTHALHAAGYAAGDELYESFRLQFGDTDPQGMAEGRFWAALDRFMSERGWGRVEQQRVHPGLGMLTATGWMESAPEGGESQPGCAFSSGFFAHFFGRVAGGPVAVLEVGCRSRGDDACRFLFGSETAVHHLYGLLLDGESVESALERV